MIIQQHGSCLKEKLYCLNFKIYKIKFQIMLKILSKESLLTAMMN